MNGPASTSLKIVYGLVVVGIILPFGLANSSWVRMTTGGSPLMLIPMLAPLALLLIGLYRIYMVARVPGTLDLPEVDGIAAAMRAIGIVCLYIGAVGTVLSWLGIPLTKMIFRKGSGTGIEFYVVGVYLAMASGFGWLGLLLFEFSRLIGFERHALPSAAAPQRPTAARRPPDPSEVADTIPLGP
jgi:hypothetical protein